MVGGGCATGSAPIGPRTLLACEPCNPVEGQDLSEYRGRGVVGGRLFSAQHDEQDQPQPEYPGQRHHERNGPGLERSGEQPPPRPGYPACTGDSTRGRHREQGDRASRSSVLLTSQDVGELVRLDQALSCTEACMRSALIRTRTTAPAEDPGTTQLLRRWLVKTSRTGTGSRGKPWVSARSRRQQNSALTGHCRAVRAASPRAGENKQG